MPYQDAAGNWYTDNGMPFQVNGQAATPGQAAAGTGAGASGTVPTSPSLTTGDYQGPDGLWYNSQGIPYQLNGQPATPDQVIASTQAGNVTPPPPPAGGGGNAGGTSGNGGGGPLASVTDVFGTQPTIPGAPQFSFPAFQAPSPFTLPSGQDVLNQDPGYDLRKNQGLGALANAFGPQGLRVSGNAGQALNDYAQSSASQEYQNAADRAAGIYNMNFNNALQSWLSNAGNALNTYQTNYGTQVSNPYLAAVGQFATNAGLQGQLFNQRFQTATA